MAISTANLTPSSAPRRNVLFILADQFRADCLGHAGNPHVKTPHLDRLATEGVSFSACFNQTAPCGPSRMCIYTSRYMCSTRVVDNMTPLADPEENVAWHLSQAGYRPGLIGYNDYAIDPARLAQDDPRRAGLAYDNVLPGFERVYYHEYDSDEYFAHLRIKGYAEELLSHRAIHAPAVPPQGPGEHLPQHFPARYAKEDSECRFVTDKAIDFIRQRQADVGLGWVLSLNYIKPHPPNICCPPYHDMYDPEQLPGARRHPGELQPGHPYLQGLAPDQLQDERHVREYRACYYGMISEVDDNIGLLIQALEETGQWDNTLIVFSSDHGEYLGDHYLTGKGHFYDSALNIPLIVRDPSREADASRGRRLDHLVESIDISPTILDFLELEIPDRFQGRSLLGAWRSSPGYVPRSEIFHEFDYRMGPLRRDPQADADIHLLWVVRDHRYKYVQFADVAMPPLLFDLAVDAGEFDNLATSPIHSSTVVEYCQKLLRWRMRHEDQRMEHWAQPHRMT